MRGRHAERLPIQTPSREVMRGLRPNLTEQISTYGHLAGGRLKAPHGLSPAPGRQIHFVQALTNENPPPAPIVQAQTPAPTPAPVSALTAPVQPPAPDPTSASAPPSVQAQTTAPAPAPVSALTAQVQPPAPEPTSASAPTSQARNLDPSPTSASNALTPAPASAVTTSVQTPTPVPTPASASAGQEVTANTAHIHIIIANPGDAAQGDGTRSSPDDSSSDGDSDSESHSNHLNPSNSSSIFADADVEQLIREAVCGAASEGASHEAVENATRAAVIKLRKMRSQTHTSRQKGRKRKNSATTSPAEPASEAASNSEITPTPREVAVHEF